MQNEWGTACVRRKQLIRELSRQKSKSSTNKLDQPVPLPQAAAAEPQPVEDAEPQPAEEAEPQLAIQPVTFPSDDEVLIVILSPWQILTDVLNRPWQAQLPIQS